MATLRKSCRNCASSKRQCSVQLPSCKRCVQKGLTCTYDLQPLGGALAQDQCSASQLLREPDFDIFGYCILDKAQAINADYIDPAICPPGRKEGRDFIHVCFANIPDQLSVALPAIFIHPKLQLRPESSHLSLIERPLDASTSYKGLRGLNDMDFTSVSLEEKLTSLQTLLVLTAPLLLSQDSVEQNGAEPWLAITESWAQHLLKSANPEALGERTPWQLWLLAESIRRTIVMAYCLICSFNAWKHGYCSNWLILESLPFDCRPGLWMAESPQRWIAAAGASVGKEVETELTSVHEFGRKMNGIDSTFCGDVFLSMLAMAHNGSSLQQLKK